MNIGRKMKEAGVMLGAVAALHGGESQAARPPRQEVRPPAATQKLELSPAEYEARRRHAEEVLQRVLYIQGNERARFRGSKGLDETQVAHEKKEIEDVLATYEQWRDPNIEGTIPDGRIIRELSFVPRTLLPLETFRKAIQQHPLLEASIRRQHEFFKKTRIIAEQRLGQFNHDKGEGTPEKQALYKAARDYLAAMTKDVAEVSSESTGSLINSADSFVRRNLREGEEYYRQLVEAFDPLVVGSAYREKYGQAFPSVMARGVADMKAVEKEINGFVEKRMERVSFTVESHAQNLLTDLGDMIKSETLTQKNIDAAVAQIKTIRALVEACIASKEVNISTNTVHAVSFDLEQAEWILNALSALKPATKEQRDELYQEAVWRGAKINMRLK